MLFFVPFATFQEQSEDEGTIWSRDGLIVLGIIINDFKVEINAINGNNVLPSIVLLEASQETLREEEARDPHLGRSLSVNPALDELQSFKEVNDV